MSHGPRGVSTEVTVTTLPGVCWWVPRSLDFPLSFPPEEERSVCEVLASPTFRISILAFSRALTSYRTLSVFSLH